MDVSPSSPVKQACLVCRAAHKKCSGACPCDRCIEMHMESRCTLPTSRRRGRPKKKQRHGDRVLHFRQTKSSRRVEGTSESDEDDPYSDGANEDPHVAPISRSLLLFPTLIESDLSRRVRDDKKVQHETQGMHGMQGQEATEASPQRGERSTNSNSQGIGTIRTVHNIEEAMDTHVKVKIPICDRILEMNEGHPFIDFDIVRETLCAAAIESELVESVLVHSPCECEVTPRTSTISIPWPL